MIVAIRRLLNICSGFVSLFIYIMMILEVAVVLTASNQPVLFTLHYTLFWVIFIDTILRTIIRPSRSFGMIRLIIGYLSALPILFHAYPGILMGALNGHIEQGLLLTIGVSRMTHLSVVFNPIRSNPAKSFVGGFILFILIGATLLSLPIAHNQPVQFLDAIYMATSAICVTGLSVLDVSSTFTRFGQIVLLGLIQIGGLGMMTFYAVVSLSLNHRFVSRESSLMQDGWSTENVKETFGIIKSIFVVTIIVEAIGAIAMYPYMMTQVATVEEGVFYAIFHAISAFCNAGFSLFSNSLAIFSGSIGFMSITALIIFIGGLGFPIIFEWYHRYIVKDRYRLKVQTRLAVWVSIWLIFGGTAVLFMGQVLIGEPVSLSMAFFHSVSARTAGFSMMDISTLSMASLWVIIVLMFIGASPGSTGGGIKTTTFGVIMLAIKSTFKGETHIRLYDREVSQALVIRALAILTVSLGTVITGFFVVLMGSTLPFMALLFETVSAFATVGYSTGISDGLDGLGKATIVLLMFIGRVGPLTLALALTRQSQVGNIRLPEEKVLLG